MKKILSLVLIMFSALSYAQIRVNDASNSPSPEIERILVTFKTPTDYALYQYTTEMLSQFRLEIDQENQKTVRQQSLAMAKQHQAFVAWTSPYNLDPEAE